jgi:hypothetical protein
MSKGEIGPRHSGWKAGKCIDLTARVNDVVFIVEFTVLRQKSNESLPQCGLFAMGFFKELL